MFLPLFYNGAWYQYSKMNALFWKKKHSILFYTVPNNIIQLHILPLILYFLNIFTVGIFF